MPKKTTVKITSEQLDTLSDEAILELRFCDLGLDIETSDVAGRLQDFYREIENHGIHFRPKVYLADEWLCPEGVPVIGIPFYLAHARLRKLEKQMMLEVEGESPEGFMRLIRHEMGHAMSYAYGFQRKKKWRDLFGHPAEDFFDYYRYKKYSRRFVQNLEEGYAQSHPDEDFAETFAVWMNPKSHWQDTYQGWPVFDKLRYVDQLIQASKNKISEVPAHTRAFNIRYLKSRIRTHYQKKRRLYAQAYPDYYDPELLGIFSKDVSLDSQKAAAFMRRHSQEIIPIVQYWTGQRKYLIYQLLRRFCHRAKDQELVLCYPEHKTLALLCACLTALLKNYDYTESFKGHV